jgi:hypothetical protein
VQPGENVAKQVSQMFVRPDREAVQKAWTAMLRMLDGSDPSFRNRAGRLLCIFSSRNAMIEELPDIAMLCEILEGNPS